MKTAIILIIVFVAILIGLSYYWVLREPALPRINLDPVYEVPYETPYVPSYTDLDGKG